MKTSISLYLFDEAVSTAEATSGL